MEFLSRFLELRIAWLSGVMKLKGIDSAPLDSSNFDGSTKLLLSPVIGKIENIKTNLTNELNEVLKVYSELESAFNSFSSSKITMEDQARQLRQEIESIQSGSGSILRRGQELREYC